MLLTRPRLLAHPHLSTLPLRGADQVFEQLLQNPIVRGSERYPALNCWEDEEHFFVEAECPGLSIENLDLTISGGHLTLSGKRPAAESEKRVFHRRERGTAEFSRTLKLPTEVDADKVEAKLKHGILTVTLPKAEQAKPRRIPVNA